MKREEKIKNLLLALGLLLIVGIAIAIPYNSLLNGQKVFSDYHLINVDRDNSLSYNELGDFIGGVLGTVVAGIACILVYITYKGQRKIAETQQFESTFFNLIRIHKDDLESIHYTDTDSRFPKELKESIGKRFENGPIPKEFEGLVWKQNLQGEEAMLREFDSNTNKSELFSKYHYSMWCNGICMILKYLSDNNKDYDSFYATYLASQITKTEWWFLYGIFQLEKKNISDTNKSDGYVELAKKLKLFNNALSYIKEQNNAITIENLYEEIEFPSSEN